MGESGKKRFVPPSVGETSYARTDGSFNPFQQPASAWKLDDSDFIRDRKQHKKWGGRFREPILITPAIMDAANAALDARARRI